MDIPAKWVAVLAVIQTVAPEAFLAGGALRDLDTGREVKDLDVFVSTPNFYAVEKTLRAAGYFLRAVQRLDYLGADPSVAEAREFVKAGELPVNVISLNDSFGFPSGLYRFDLGLCQIGFDGREVVRTAAYVTDVQHQRMTVCRCGSEAQMERTEARGERLRGKYPGWPLHVPEQFREFVFEADMVFEGDPDIAPI
jgi:hypothetical protein